MIKQQQRRHHSADCKQIEMTKFQESENSKRIELLQKAKSLDQIGETGFTVKTVGGEREEATTSGGVVTCEICHVHVKDTTDPHSNKQK